MIRSSLIVLCIGFLLSFTKVANATLIDITGAGTWSSTAPISAFSAPSETWDFSFNLPQTFSPSGNGISVTQISNFDYSLNGSPVLTPNLSSIKFYDYGDGGLFDLSFNNGDIVSLYGADVGSSGTLSLGTFYAGIAMNDGSATGSGSVTLSIPSATPEPSTLVLFGTGIILMGYMASKRKKGLPNRI